MYLLSAHYMTGTVLGTWDIAVTKIWQSESLFKGIQSGLPSTYLSYFCLPNKFHCFHDRLTNIGKWLIFAFFRLNVLCSLCQSLSSKPSVSPHCVPSASHCDLCVVWVHLGPQPEQGSVYRDRLGGQPPVVSVPAPSFPCCVLLGKSHTTLCLSFLLHVE